VEDIKDDMIQSFIQVNRANRFPYHIIETVETPFWEFTLAEIHNLLDGLPHIRGMTEFSNKTVPDEVRERENYAIERFKPLINGWALGWVHKLHLMQTQAELPLPIGLKIAQWCAELTMEEMGKFHIILGNPYHPPPVPFLISSLND
jgi:hypothetical protein